MSLNGILNSTDPNTMVVEKHTIMVENYTGAEIAVGDHLCFVTAANGDGKRVEVAATDNLSAYAGCATKAIGTSKGGLIQSKGWIEQAQYISSTDLVAGQKLIPVATKPYLGQAGAGVNDGAPAFAIFCSTVTVTAASTALAEAILYGY